jgi:hypothetical protein
MATVSGDGDSLSVMRPPIPVAGKPSFMPDDIAFGNASSPVIISIDDVAARTMDILGTTIFTGSGRSGVRPPAPEFPAAGRSGMVPAAVITSGGPARTAVVALECVGISGSAYQRDR